MKLAWNTQKNKMSDVNNKEMNVKGESKARLTCTEK
ncbi:hypothetical protein HMPREF9994_11658 [Staphylococcus epidermidis NIHLM088]|nr:hypothetical protein HMPREF9994_11658 [Staphylococcus epidermidis NIHLM088]